MKKNFFSAPIFGAVNAMFKNLATDLNCNDPIEIMQLINSGQCTGQRISRWGVPTIMKDGTITLQVQSAGITGHEWKEKLYEKKYSFDSIVNSYLEYIIPTNGFIYSVVIINGNQIKNKKITIEEVNKIYSEKNKLQAATFELAFILMDILAGTTMQKLGLERIIVMMDPVKPKDFMYGIEKLLFSEFFEPDKWYLTQGVPQKAISPKGIGFAFVSEIKVI